jgi:hypothetical protein
LKGRKAARKRSAGRAAKNVFKAVGRIGKLTLYRKKK